MIIDEKDNKTQYLEKLKELKKEGEELLSTRYNPNNYSDMLILAEDHVNDEKFNKWKTSCILLLEQMNLDSSFLQEFRDNIQYSTYREASDGVSRLKALIEHIENNSLTVNTKFTDNFDFNPIENIFTKFHKVAKQLKHRHNNRATLVIDDEYDVQYLLNALLLLYFDDIRPEEWAPSHAGTSSRMDFLIKDINVVIETKMTRKGLKDKKIKEELTIDIADYANHPNCDMLYCFVYDKEELIKNPAALENDLSGNKNGLEVKVVIFPK